jgi:hypothetical protein
MMNERGPPTAGRFPRKNLANLKRWSVSILACNGSATLRTSRKVGQEERARRGELRELQATKENLLEVLAEFRR